MPCRVRPLARRACRALPGRAPGGVDGSPPPAAAVAAAPATARDNPPRKPPNGGGGGAETHAFVVRVTVAEVALFFVPTGTFGVGMVFPDVVVLAADADASPSSAPGPPAAWA